MKIRLLIAVTDNNYEKHLSKVLSNNPEIQYDITAFTQKSYFIETLKNKIYDIILFEQTMFDTDLNFKNSKLFILLTDENTNLDYFEKFSFIQKIHKYQRISNISREMLDYYSKVSDVKQIWGTKSSVNITSVFSPAGGVGKTSIAIAYALKLANLRSDIEKRQRVFYLNLENFASTHIYFSNAGKGISDVLSKIERINPAMLMSLKQQDSRSGISYFSMPQNYDDMNVITEENINQILTSIANANICDELIIDLPSIADKKTIQVFEKSDSIFLVTDFSQTAQQKMSQFVNQHNIFEEIRSKVTLIINKNGNDKTKIDGIDKNIKLPFINLIDGYALCENLAQIFQKEMANNS